MRSHQGTLRLLLCIALTIGFPIALWCSGDVDCCDVGETLQPRHPLFFNGGDYFTEIVWGDPNGITDSMWCEPGIDYLFIFHPTLVEDDGYGLGDLDYCVRSNNSIGGIHNFFYDDKMDSFSTTIGFITEADPGNEVSVRITHDGGNPLLSVLSLTMTEPALCDSDDPTGNTDKRTIRLWRGPYFDNSPQEFVFTEVFVVLWQNEILPANPGPLGVWNPSITIHERFENRNGQILFPPDGIQATYDSSMPPPYVVLDGYGFPRCDFRYTAPSGGWYCIPVE
ncbi:hypothetical protein JXA47_09190, partial [Candidatus Sumerlaeota bacterium]|nr:hypothetical protein [Candidatus Sumerlaeota bacterium]